MCFLDIILTDVGILYKHTRERKQNKSSLREDINASELKDIVMAALLRARGTRGQTHFLTLILNLSFPVLEKP